MFKHSVEKIYWKPRWWGNDGHKFFTVVVFIILASLDNAARGVFPPLYAVIARDLVIKEAALGFVSALNILVVAITAVMWGYWGDRGSRKRLLLFGTLIWSAAMFLTGLSRSYMQLLFFQMVTAVGIGCISSVGFSVVTDLIPPARRGFAMSFWGLSQGGGGGAGALLGGMVGAYNWSLPFFIIAAAGLFFAVLYLFTLEPQRGRSEPELSQIFVSGKRYKHRIQRADIRVILTRRSNIWLFTQSLLATVAYGSLMWMPRLFISRVENANYSLETATVSGNLLSLLFQTGFYFAILAGHLGDRWQQRQPGGRARFCMMAVFAAIPFQIALFFVPLHGFTVPANGPVIAVAWATLLTIVTNPWLFWAFLLALVAVAFSSAEIPNRNALLTDVNLPEHRGTVAGMQAIAVGVGVAIGSTLAGVLFNYLARQFAPPINYAVGLALFQILFIPAGFCYYKLSKTTAQDIAAVKRTLNERAKLTIGT